MNALPYCYFPTEIVCIDDDEDTLKTLDLTLSKDEATYKFFDNPIDGLSYLNKTKPTILFDRLVTEDKFPFDENAINSLYEEVYNPGRYEEISCLVVDQTMPELKGLDLCQKIDNPTIKKILLTGVSEENMAIEAFNNGIIDFYVRKHDTKSYDLLNEFIKKSRIQYFQSLTTTTIQPILKNWHNYNRQSTALLEPAFVDYFDSLVKDHKIIEYYLLDIIGSFIFLDPNGNLSALFVFNDETLENNQDVVEDIIYASKNLSPDLIDDLRSQKKTVCPPLFLGSSDTPEKSIYPLTPLLNGQRRFYVAYATEINGLDQNKILNFKQYQSGLKSKYTH
jgi:CheY-like chemotaxis protein